MSFPSFFLSCFLLFFDHWPHPCQLLTLWHTQEKKGVIFKCSYLSDICANHSELLVIVIISLVKINMHLNIFSQNGIVLTVTMVKGCLKVLFAAHL